MDGELLLADLGSGPYTADYFGEKRYQYPHTRSYWHNLPLLQGMEQKPTANRCIVDEVLVDEKKVGITMELAMLYLLPELESFRRKIELSMEDHTIMLTDKYKAYEKITIEEGFVSVVKPMEVQVGVLQWKGKKGQVTLYYDAAIMDYVIEEIELSDHRNHYDKRYRLGLKLKQKNDNISIRLNFLYDVYHSS